MNYNNTHIKSPSSGAVLLLVIVLVAMMFLIAHTLLVITMVELQLSDFELRATQAFYTAESSVTLGLTRLQKKLSYRNDFSETIAIGANTGLCSVNFYDGTKDGHGHYRKELAPSLYRVIVQGIGSVGKANIEHGAARRAVEQEIYLKPFAVFAEEDVRLRGETDVDGNVHGNSGVSMSAKSGVSGAITFSDGEDATEPKMTLPSIDISQYIPQYKYKGKIYTAEPLQRETVSSGSPANPTIELYSGIPDGDNPAGIFILDVFAPGSSSAIDVNGTVVILGSLTFDGAVNIVPVAPYPAIISVADVELRLDDLNRYTTDIQGMIYSSEEISIRGFDLDGTVIHGSVWGKEVTLSDIGVAYDEDIESNQPPGIALFELAEWKEILDTIPRNDDD